MENADLTFKQYEKALVTFSASIIRNFEDAQDVVSEVFLECFENKKQVEKPLALMRFKFYVNPINLPSGRLLFWILSCRFHRQPSILHIGIG